MRVVRHIGLVDFCLIRTTMSRSFRFGKIRFSCQHGSITLVFLFTFMLSSLPFHTYRSTNTSQVFVVFTHLKISVIPCNAVTVELEVVTN